MLKKVCIHDPINTSPGESRKICCSVCKCGEKSEYYFCKTGRHIICENCQYGEPTKNRRDDGDYVTEPEYARRVLSSEYNRNVVKDLSSGDHYIRNEHYNTTQNSNEVNLNGVMPACTSKVHCANCNNSTVVVYRNEKFNHGISVIDTNFFSSLNEIENKLNCEVTRPVVCPVTSCAKIVTIDTISQHFNFDHSKIPRLMLLKNRPHEISLKYSTLSADTKCLAVFTVSTEKRLSHTALKRVESRTSVHDTLDSQLLLLMSAKLSTALKAEPSIRKCGNSVQGVSRKNIQNHKLRGSKSNPENSTWMNKSIHNSVENEVILLWLCKINDKSRVYTINISSEDRRQGYSYIGDAVHIRHEQNPNYIYNTTECIAIRKAAINKLITADKELKVIISRVQ